MHDSERTPGPLARQKKEIDAESGHPTPVEAEVESARIFENQARQFLRQRGLTDEQIHELADLFVAEDLGDDLDQFIEWATDRARIEGLND